MIRERPKTRALRKGLLHLFLKIMKSDHRFFNLNHPQSHTNSKKKLVVWGVEVVSRIFRKLFFGLRSLVGLDLVFGLFFLVCASPRRRKVVHEPRLVRMGFTLTRRSQRQLVGNFPALRRRAHSYQVHAVCPCPDISGSQTSFWSRYGVALHSKA